MNKLTDLQRDALLEIFNIGVGNAANSMSKLIDEEISLSVPKLQIVLQDHAAVISAFVQSQRICAVSQNFTGPLNARAFLVFPEGRTHDIVRRMLGEMVSADELNTMEEEALSEIGNIILNACISSMSELLQSEFKSSLPHYHLGKTSDVLSSNDTDDNQFMLLLHIDFSMPKEKIDGYLVFLLSLQSFNELIRKIDLFLAQI
jgi:chemotaxis protein CheC